ncbi:MAG: hypothetical protein QM820_36895 [Minicystis sp.]
MLRRFFLAASLFLAACSSSPAGNPMDSDGGPPGVRALMSFEASAGFFDAPFPIEHRRAGDGTLRLEGFPDPAKSGALAQILALAAASPTGFSPNGAIFVRFDGAVDAARLPSVRDSVAPDSPLFLVNVSAGSPRYGERVPIDARFKAIAETYSPENLLAVMPYPGLPLQPETTYALVVRRSLGGADGRPLSPAEAWSRLAAGEAPEGANGPRAKDDFAPLLGWLAHEGLDAANVAATTVFTTGDPRAHQLRWRAHVESSLPPPAATMLDASEVYDDYCVVKGHIDLPLFQKGPKPYDAEGTGHIVEDASGNPVVQEHDDLGFVITIPKKAMPPAGFPIVLYATGSGGSRRHVLDRTAKAENPNDGLGPPGRGPALYFARRAIAAFGFPAPLAWDRNPKGESGDSATFNIDNLAAFRGNVQQGALDFTSLVKLAKGITFDASLCPGATTTTGTFRYDPSRIYFYGHSTGSTFGGLVIPSEPGISAGMLSGGGGTWIQELTMAESPVKYSVLVKVLLGMDPEDDLDLFDPPLTLFQTVMDPVDVTNWARHIAKDPLPGNAPKPLLFIEGVIDTFHFPRMANTHGMAAGLDVIAPLVDPSAADDYALAGHGAITAPASNNIQAPGGSVTGVTLQREQRPGIDGHHVPFEWGDVKYRYSCFFDSLVKTGTAVLPPPNDDGLADCP